MADTRKLATLRSTLLTVHAAVEAALASLDELDDPCPQCGKAQWEELHTAGGTRARICLACGHEMKQEAEHAEV